MRETLQSPLACRQFLHIADQNSLSDPGLVHAFSHSHNAAASVRSLYPWKFKRPSEPGTISPYIAAISSGSAYARGCFYILWIPSDAGINIRIVHCSSPNFHQYFSGFWCRNGYILSILQFVIPSKPGEINTFHFFRNHRHVSCPPLTIYDIFSCLYHIPALIKNTSD